MNEVAFIQNMIYEVRGQKVMLDSDLAELYGVETKRLKEAVKRNIRRFEGDDFMFILTRDEMEHIRLRSQIASSNSIENQINAYLRTQFASSSTSEEKQLTIINKQKPNSNWGGSRYLPFAFTELGVAMLSSVLRSDVAIDINRNIMRAFVELRKIVSSVSTNYTELKQEINDVKQYIEELLSDQNEINEENRAQLDAISEALAQLQSNNPQPRRPIIGFSKLSDKK